MNRNQLLWGLAIITFLGLLPFWASTFYIYTFSTIFVTGLLAVSLNFVLGYGGIYQFNHAVFYGVGAYTFALILSKTSFPAWVGFAFGPFLSILLSFFMGVLCIRLSKLYFGMLQISLGSLIWAVAVKWYNFTGGDNGIHGIPLPSLLSSTKGAYYSALIVSSICIATMYFLVRSPFGATLQATRENPVRSEAIGINIKNHQLTGLILAGFFAGVAGELFVIVEGSVFPDLMSWTLSLEIIVMCLLGGMFTYLGPILGVTLIISLRIILGAFTEYWTLFMGIIMMFLIYFLPQGVLGYLEARLKIVSIQKKE